MALIKCPECGRENVSDIAEMCPECGYPVKKYFEQQKSDCQTTIEQQNGDAGQVESVECREEDEKTAMNTNDDIDQIQKQRETQKKNKVKVRVYIGIAAVAAVAAIVIVAINIAIPMLRYKKANELFSQQNYEQAQLIYENLGDYKDALTKVEDCKLEIVKSELEIVKSKIEENIELEKSLEYLSKIEYTSEVAVIKEECISKLIYKNYDEGHYITALNYINQIEEKEQFKEIEIDCLWNRANNEYDEGNYLQAITYLDKIGDLTELEDNGVLADELLQKSLQAYGMDLFNSGDFNSAVKYLKRLDPKDDMINETIDIAMFMDKLQGVWYSDGSRSGHEYNGWTETQILYASNGAVMFTNDWEMNKIYEQIYVKGTILYLESQAPGLEYEIRMYFQDDNLVRVEPGDKEFNEADKLFTYEKVESFPEPAKKPSIGMTAQEVLDSTWGKPEKINKSTYTWGVTEQWCYSGYRYIYLEDGIVTSISE